MVVYQEACLQKFLDIFPGGFPAHLKMLLKIPQTKPVPCSAFQKSPEFVPVQLAMAPPGQKPRSPIQALAKQILPERAKPGSIGGVNRHRGLASQTDTGQKGVNHYELLF
jgi:hypothetical protein